MNLLELYQERVAIMEIDGGVPTAKAQWDAYVELRQKYGKDALPKEIHEIARKAAGML